MRRLLRTLRVRCADCFDCNCSGFTSIHGEPKRFHRYRQARAFFGATPGLYRLAYSNTYPLRTHETPGEGDGVEDNGPNSREGTLKLTLRSNPLPGRGVFPSSYTAHVTASQVRKAVLLARSLWRTVSESSTVSFADSDDRPAGHENNSLPLLGMMLHEKIGCTPKPHDKRGLHRRRQND